MELPERRVALAAVYSDVWIDPDVEHHRPVDWRSGERLDELVAGADHESVGAHVARDRGEDLAPCEGIERFSIIISELRNYRFAKKSLRARSSEEPTS